MSAATLARRMADAGASADLIAIAIEEMEAMQLSLDARRTADRDRKRAQRERRKAADVTGHSEDSHGTVTAIVTDKGSLEVSPHTPLPKPTKSAPLSPPKSGKAFLPANWTPPPVSELPPRAKALAEQWTDASYQTQAEGFALYWRNERKMRPDWTGTWANWIIRIHSQVMRDQKFGNAPTDKPSKLSADELRAQLEKSIPFYEKIGRKDDADECRRKLASIGQVAKDIVKQARAQ